MAVNDARKFNAGFVPLLYDSVHPHCIWNVFCVVAKVMIIKEILANNTVFDTNYSTGFNRSFSDCVDYVIVNI